MVPLPEPEEADPKVTQSIPGETVQGQPNPVAILMVLSAPEDGKAWAPGVRTKPATLGNLNGEHLDRGCGSSIRDATCELERADGRWYAADRASGT